MRFHALNEMARIRPDAGPVEPVVAPAD